MRWSNTATSPGNGSGKGARNGGALSSRPPRQPSKVSGLDPGIGARPLRHRAQTGSPVYARLLTSLGTLATELAHARTPHRAVVGPGRHRPRGSMTSSLKALAMRSSRHPPPRSATMSGHRAREMRKPALEALAMKRTEAQLGEVTASFGIPELKCAEPVGHGTCSHLSIELLTRPPGVPLTQRRAQRWSSGA
jgi:hypothetical protein